MGEGEEGESCYVWKEKWMKMEKTINFQDAVGPYDPDEEYDE